MTIKVCGRIRCFTYTFDAINVILLNVILLSVILLNIIMLSDIILWHYVECCFAECCYAKCRYYEYSYAECHYYKCHGIYQSSNFKPFTYTRLSDTIPNSYHFYCDVFLKKCLAFVSKLVRGFYKKHLMSNLSVKQLAKPRFMLHRFYWCLTIWSNGIFFKSLFHFIMQKLSIIS